MIVFVPDDPGCERCGHDAHLPEQCAEGHNGDPSGASTGGTPIEADGCLCGSPEFDQTPATGDTDDEDEGVLFDDD
jgi:hypothetical protein